MISNDKTTRPKTKSYDNSDAIIDNLLEQNKNLKKEYYKLKKKQDKGSYKGFADDILDKYNVITDRATGMLYLYNDDEHYYECKYAENDLKKIVIIQT